MMAEGSKKKNSLIGCGVLVVIIIIIAIAIGTCMGGNSSPSSTKTPTTQQQTTPEATIRAIIHDELGACNREGVDKIAGIGINNAGYGYVIDIHFAIDDNLSEDYIKGGARIDVLDTMEAIYTSGYDIQWIDMYGTFSMVDKYGNASEMEVIHARLGKETAAKINWENMTRDRLFEILDFKDIHPAFM